MFFNLVGTSEMMILKIPNQNKMLELSMVLSSTSEYHIDNRILDTSLHDQ